jgi:16S rRNA (adenine1518-N6/adenine1519-N6)-dimethyltransferase
LELLPRAEPPVRVADERVLFGVVKAAFSQRRKTLMNCLSSGDPPLVPRADAERLIRSAGVAPGVRGEMLSLEQFAAIANALSASSADARRLSA